MTYPAQNTGTPITPMPVAVGAGEVGGSGGAQPGWRQLGAKRLIAVLPITHNPVDKGFEQGSTQASVTFDLIVCDGAPFTYGDREKPMRTPATHRVDRIPAKFASVKSSHRWFVNRLVPMIGKGQMLAGRLNMDTSKGGNAFWFLEDLPDADKQIVSQAWQIVHAPGYSNDPIELAQASQPTMMQVAVPGGSISVVAPPSPAGWPAEQWANLTDAQRAQVLGAGQPQQPVQSTQPPF